MKNGNSIPRLRRWPGERGFSLIELLIALAMFSFIALGTLPMLVRSIADSNRGWEATKVSNFAQSTLEPALAADFESPILEIRAGLIQRARSDSWTQGASDKLGDDKEGWTSAVSGRGRVEWRRYTYIRQYDVDNLYAPISGDNPPAAVHVKEVQVNLVGERRGGALGAGQEMWIRVFKAY